MVNRWRSRKPKRGCIPDKCIICDSGETMRYDGRRRSCCFSCQTSLRRLRNKLSAISMKGEECGICSISVSIASFNFHHRNGEEKNNRISRMNKSSWKSICAELDLCTMLCSCCHNIEHSNRFEGVRLQYAVAGYKGDKSDLYLDWFSEEERQLLLSL